LELDDNAAGFEADALGEGFELLGKDRDGSFDQKRGMCEAFLVKLGEDAGDFALALDLVEAVVALGQTL
jgi:hypothetical protein